MRTYCTLTVLTLSLLLLAGSAWAQTEINHAKAIAGGVTPGDAPGYPVTLSLAGSYKLTGSLSGPNANTSAIVITSSFVTLDLNGFVIHGTTVCTGTPVTSCSPTGSGIGVNATGRKSIVVRNGQVFAMGSAGIKVGQESRVERVSVRSNGLDGIKTDVNSRVTDCSAHNNGGIGIGTTTTTNNMVTNSEASGIIASGTVLNNTAVNNGGHGLFLGSQAGYANNVLNNNSGGNDKPQVFDGIEIGTNVCGGDTICP